MRGGSCWMKIVWQGNLFRYEKRGSKERVGCSSGWQTVCVYVVYSKREERRSKGISGGQRNDFRKQKLKGFSFVRMWNEKIFSRIEFSDNIWWTVVCFSCKGVGGVKQKRQRKKGLNTFIANHPKSKNLNLNFHHSPRTREARKLWAVGRDEENVHLYLLRACDMGRDKVDGVVWGKIWNVILYFLHRPLFVGIYISITVLRDWQKKMFSWYIGARKDLDMQGKGTNLKIVCRAKHTELFFVRNILYLLAFLRQISSSRHA